MHRQAANRASWPVRIGRVVFFSMFFALIAVRLADFGVGCLTPSSGCRVTGVIEGDTVRLICPDGGAIRGRLVGFDTPEVVSPGCAAEYAQGVAAT